MASPMISVVMVSYQTGPALLEAVSAVMAADDIDEVILVDNGNSKAARETLWTLIGGSSKIRVAQGHGNIGFGSACNYGAALSSGESLLFLNPDTVMAPGMASKISEAGASLSAPWIIGGILRDANGQEQRGSRRGAVTPWTALRSFTGLGDINLHKAPMPEGLTPMPTISGAAFMMSRKSFDQVGGFDENYFLHVEDIDLCRRVKLAGGEVYVLPEANIVHHGATSNASTLTVERHKLESFIRYFWNYSDAVWAKFLCLFAVPFLAVAILGRALLKSLLRGGAGR